MKFNPSHNPTFCRGQHRLVDTDAKSADGHYVCQECGDPVNGTNSRHMNVQPDTGGTFWHGSDTERVLLCSSCAEMYERYVKECEGLAKIVIGAPA